jgi:hypothetical protein
MIAWLRRFNQGAKDRGKLVIEAREVMQRMGAVWEKDAARPSDEVTLLLMQVGLSYIKAVYRGMLMGQDRIRAGKAKLN